MNQVNQQGFKPGDYQPSQEILDLFAKHGQGLHGPGTKAGVNDVDWAGKKIVLPALPVPMPLEKAAFALLEKAEEENTLIDVKEIVEALPFDGAQAFMQAVEALFGFGLMRKGEVQTMFGKMKVPPVLKSIRTGPNPEDFQQVIWGGVAIPALTPDDGSEQVVLQCSMALADSGRVVFQVEGKIPRGKSHILHNLMTLTRIFAKERSIYKGKAFRMFVTSEGKLDLNREPEFILTNPRIEDELIFSKETEGQIKTSLFTPIKNADACRKMGISLKRGVLLEGPYGVGKSMTAAATASIAVQNGWTFILLEQVGALKQALEFAKQYAPCVVFAEDMDRALNGEQRTIKIDDILNTLDGVDTKGAEVITVLTTNHVADVNRAMLRPGRIDALVSIGLPDEDAAEKLARQYGRGYIKADHKLVESPKILQGRIPAAIREAVERAKLAAIGRVGGVPSEITDSDLVIAAVSMDAQLALLNKPHDGAQTPTERLGEAFKDVVHEQLANGKIGVIDARVQKLANNFGLLN